LSELREAEQKVCVIALWLEPGAARHLLEVAACAERVARSGQHEDPYVRVVARVVERIEQLVDHLRADRVLPFGYVERDGSDRALERHADRSVAAIFHAHACPTSAAAARPAASSSRWRILRASSTVAGSRPTSRVMRTATSTIAPLLEAISPFGK